MTEDADRALREALQARTAAEDAHAAADARNRSERAQRVAAYEARMSEVRSELIAAGERTVELLLSAPRQGNIERVVVHQRSFGRRVEKDGWKTDVTGTSARFLFTPDRRVFYYHPKGLQRAPSEDSLEGWVDVRLHYVMAKLHSGYDSPSIEWTQWASESNSNYGNGELGQALRGALEATRREVIDTYAALLAKGGATL